MRAALLICAIVLVSGVSLGQGEADVPIRVHVVHEGEPETARIQVEDALGGDVVEREVLVEGEADVELSLPPSIYVVTLSIMRPAMPLPVSADPLDGEEYVGTGADVRGCPGEFLFRFWIAPTSFGNQASGCLARPAAFDSMLADARERPLSLRRFEVAAPRDADRGEWLTWSGIGPMIEDEADEVPFESHPDATFPDAWGRETAGEEIVFRSLTAHGVGSRSKLGASAEASSGRPLEILRYAQGETTPTAWSRTVASLGSADTAPSVALAREVRYDAPGGMLPCLLRAPIQGRTLAPGDALAADEVCDAWSDAAWTAGAPIEVAGVRALPLYQIEGDGAQIARWLVVDGLAYPLEVELYAQEATGIVHHAHWRLRGLESGGAPALRENARTPEPAATLAAIDPLRGPADETGGAFPFPLAQAADAAMADPSLRGLQTLLARGDAALVGASYGLSRDATSGLTLQRWALVYSAPDAEPVLVVCSQPEAPLRVVARCEAPREAPGFAEPLHGAPAMGRDAMPRSGASFGTALARWSADAPVGFAVYRAWEQDGAPVVGIGHGVPAPLAPAAGTQTDEGTYALVELASGRTLAHADMIHATAGIAPAPLGFASEASLRAAEGLAGGRALPLVVGAGLALGLLALLGFALYTRLVRARVLDDDTRRRIVEIVREEPGIHASGVFERLGKGGGVGEYHLDVLVREGFLAAIVTPGFRRYFVAGSMSTDAMRARATLKDGVCEQVHTLILARPGMTLGELAAEAQISAAYASKTVARLVAAGLVEKRVEGRTVALLARPAPAPDRQGQAGASRYLRT